MAGSVTKTADDTYKTSDGKTFTGSTALSQAVSHQQVVDSKSSSSSSSSSSTKTSTPTSTSTGSKTTASAGKVTYGPSPLGGNAYNTSDGNSYGSQSAAQAHQDQLNAASSTPAATTAAPTTYSWTAPSGTTYTFPSQAAMQQYINEQNNSQAATQTPVATNTQQQSTQQDNSNSSLLSQLLAAIQKMIPTQSSVNVPSSDQITSLANQYAKLQVDPQLTALQNQLSTAQTQEQGQLAQIQAANSQLPNQAQTMLTKARQQAMNDAAARGAGTSGVYDYDYTQLSEPVMEQVNQANAQSTAAQQAAINQLGTTQQNISTQQGNLATQQGQIASQYAENLNEYYTAAQNQDYQSMMNSALNLLALQLQAATSGSVVGGTGGSGATTGNTGSTGTTPAITGNTGTPSTGNTQTSTPTTGTSPTTSLATAVTAAGGTISWDPTTGNVTINGKVYTPTQLQRMGGYLDPTSNHWYLPQSVISSLL